MKFSNAFLEQCFTTYDRLNLTYYVGDMTLQLISALLGGKTYNVLNSFCGILENR